MLSDNFFPTAAVILISNLKEYLTLIFFHCFLNIDKNLMSRTNPVSRAHLPRFYLFVDFTQMSEGYLGLEQRVCQIVLGVQPNHFYHFRCDFDDIAQYRASAMNVKGEVSAYASLVVKSRFAKYFFFFNANFHFCGSGSLYPSVIVTALFLFVHSGYKGEIDASHLHAGTFSMPLSRKLPYTLV